MRIGLLWLDDINGDFLALAQNREMPLIDQLGVSDAHGSVLLLVRFRDGQEHGVTLLSGTSRWLIVRPRL